MYRVLKPLKWFERETGRVLEFVGAGVSKCGKKIEDLGEDMLKDLEANGYIAKDTSNTGAARPKVEPVEFDKKKDK